MRVVRNGATTKLQNDYWNKQNMKQSKERERERCLQGEHAMTCTGFLAWPRLPSAVTCLSQAR